MMIENSVFINEIGKRSNNEDSVYPDPKVAQPVPGLYLVCDGVGGAEKGEVASKMACTLFAEYFAEHPARPVGQEFLEDGVKHLQLEFDKYIGRHPESRGMATTFTLISFDNLGATVAFAGDSRIYQIRNGKIIFATRDHSWVNLQIDLGKLDAETARKHPNRNVIIRALQARSAAQTVPEICRLTDVAQGDCFLMCTDGVTESFGPQELEALFREEKPLELYMKTIKDRCMQTSSDNFSAYLIQVGNMQSATARIPAANSNMVYAVPAPKQAKPTLGESLIQMFTFKRKS